LLTFITRAGVVMRTPAADISRLGRSTQGVTILNIDRGDRVAALSCEEPEEDEERSDRVIVNINGDGAEV
jgi:DNA gyrase subunit A